MRKLVAILTIALAGCSGGDFTAPVESVADTFTLHTINGAALPATLGVDDRGEISLVDDSFQFYDGGAYVETGHLRTTKNGVATTQALTSPGTYTRNGSQVTLVSSAGTIIGSFTDAVTLTIVSGQNTLIFRR
jgi:hypothetical protein